MRGLYNIPTRARKSEWYEVPGKFHAAVPSDESDSFWNGGGTLSFYPEGTKEHYALISGNPKDALKGSSVKVVSILASASQVSPVRNWHAKLYLRKITPVGSDAYWNLVESSSHVCISHTVSEEIGEDGHDKLIQELLSSAKTIEWPPDIPNDEGGPEPVEVDFAQFDKEMWEKIKTAFLETFPLEDDQISPDLTLNDIGMDSLDGVILSTHLEDVFDITLEDDRLEELFDKTNTVRDIYNWILAAKDQGNAELVDD